MVIITLILVFIRSGSSKRAYGEVVTECLTQCTYLYDIYSEMKITPTQFAL